MKSGNLNFLEPSGPLQACNGTDLPFTRYSGQFLMELEDSRQILEKYYQISRKNCRVGAELFHTDGDGCTDGRKRRS